MKSKRIKQSDKHSRNRLPVATSATISIENPGNHMVPAADRTSQGLKFVDVTTRYIQGTWNPAEQKSIRVHVMQDFLRQRKQPVHVIEPPAMAGTMSSHVHRFRIAKPRLPSDKVARIVSSEKDALYSGQSRQSMSSVTPSTALGNCWGLPEFERAVLAPVSRLSQWKTLAAEGKASASTLRIAPNLPGVMSRMDPFVRLPIDGSMEIHEILDYYRTSYWSNSLAINPDGRWLSVAAADPALFHAQLSLVIQHQALMRGTPLPEQYYYHRGTAISIVTSRLGHPVEAISDSTIGAVALLSNSDNYLDVSPEFKHSHIKGLVSMVKLRGGVHTLSTNESVKRVVTWADLVHAAVNNSTPCLGMSKCNAGYNLKQLFPASTSKSSPTRMMYPESPPVPAPLQEVFETIRLLSTARSSPDIVDLQSTVNRRILANVLYRVEYLLLDPFLLPPEIPEGHETLEELHHHNFRRPLFSAITAGAFIFTYSCLRNLAIHSRLFQRLVKRLRVNLQLVFDEEKLTVVTVGGERPSLNEKMDSPSSIKANPSLVLWLLMHGFKGTLWGNQKGDQEWFIWRGADICRNLKIQSLDELRLQTRRIVAFQEQCVPATEAFWKAICDRQQMEQA